MHSYRQVLLHEMFNGREVLSTEYNEVQNGTCCGYICVQKIVGCVCICPLFTDRVTCIEALRKL